MHAHVQRGESSAPVAVFRQLPLGAWRNGHGKLSRALHASQHGRPVKATLFFTPPPHDLYMRMYTCTEVWEFVVSEQRDLPQELSES